MSHDTDSHPSRARLVACVDGEVPAEERARLSRHVEECRRCERRMEELRASSRTFSEAVGHLQPPPSDATADEIRRRTDRRDDAT
ncbi:MAG: anti-sigma factor, partial [Gemmatimonadota bacterium]